MIGEKEGLTRIVVKGREAKEAFLFFISSGVEVRVGGTDRNSKTTRSIPAEAPAIGAHRGPRACSMPVIRADSAAERVLCFTDVQCCPWEYRRRCGEWAMQEWSDTDLSLRGVFKGLACFHQHTTTSEFSQGFFAMFEGPSSRAYRAWPVERLAAMICW